LFGLVLFSGADSLWAQSDRGVITGTLIDPSTAAIADAAVTAINSATRVSGLTGFSSTGLSVAGPMARSAPDLMAALQVLGGPDGYDRKAWSWTLPPSRKPALKDFRVGYVLDSPMASPTSEVRPVLQRTISALERTGAPLRPGWPRSYNLSEAFNNYMFLLSALIFSREPKEAQESDRKKYQQNPTNPFGAGALSSYAEWQQQCFRQLAFRALWQEYFEEIDVFLMPCSFTVAFHHNHEEDLNSRTLDTPDGKRPYMQLMPWMVTATLTGCPATAAPIGQSLSGLPVGIQIMGPFLGRCDTHRVRRSSERRDRRF